MKKLFKILSLVLAVVMLTSMIPLFSNAAVIKNINLNYHFKALQSIRYSSRLYGCDVISSWYNEYDKQYSGIFYGRENKSYYAVFSLESTDGNVFAEDINITFNGVNLTQSQYLTENSFVFKNDRKNIDFKVVYKYLKFNASNDYSEDINKAISNNSGFYIKDEVISPNLLKFDSDYHFEKWNTEGNVFITSPDIYNSTIVMGNTQSNVLATYSKHSIKKVKTVESTKTSNGSIKYACDCGYNYSLVIPKKPNLKVTNGTASIKLSWSKVNPATRYYVFQYNTKTKKYTKIGSTTSTSYLIKGKKPGTAYYYLVRAYNGNIGSSFKTKDVVKAFTLCISPKAKASVANKTVTLKWAKVSGAKYYAIYKYNAKTKKYSGIKKLTATSAELSKQAKGTNYYLVRAFNANNAGSAFTTNNLVKAAVK